MKRILLSIPHMGGNEEIYVRQAFATNWLSTAGSNIIAFEDAFQERIGLPAAALSSGTAAIHLGLRLLGVGPSDEVFCPTLTFAASCNPVRYLGAECVFLDSDYATWNLDPNILEDALRRRALRNQLPARSWLYTYMGNVPTWSLSSLYASVMTCRCWKTPPKPLALRTATGRREHSAASECSLSME